MISPSLPRKIENRGDRSLEDPVKHTTRFGWKADDGRMARYVDPGASFVMLLLGVVQLQLVTHEGIRTYRTLPPIPQGGQGGGGREPRERPRALWIVPSHGMGNPSNSRARVSVEYGLSASIRNRYSLDRRAEL